MRRDGAGEFPAAESGKFFFYNPNAKAGEGGTKKADKEEKKKKKKAAKVVDVGDGDRGPWTCTLTLTRSRGGRKPKKSSATPEAAPATEDKKTAADMGSIVARLEEDRGRLPRGGESVERTSGQLRPRRPRRSSTGRSTARFGQVSTTDPCHNTRTRRGSSPPPGSVARAARPREGSAASTAAARRHARASTLAPVPGRPPPLIPALRRWRSARAECDEAIGGDDGDGDDGESTFGGGR